MRPCRANPGPPGCHHPQRLRRLRAAAEQACGTALSHDMAVFSRGADLAAAAAASFGGAGVTIQARRAPPRLNAASAASGGPGSRPAAPGWPAQMSAPIS